MPNHDGLGTLLIDCFGVGEQTARRLDKLGLKTVKDFLFFYPRSYEDRRRLPKINQLEDDKVFSILGYFSNFTSQKVGKKVLIKGKLKDATGSIACVWFNQAYLKSVLKEGVFLYLKGKVERNSFTNERQLIVQETERLDGDISKNPDFNQLLPVYPLVAGLYQSKMRELSRHLLESYSQHLFDFFDGSIRKELQLMPLHEAILNVHFPKTHQLYTQARERLVFNECFFVQFPYMMHHHRRQTKLRVSPWGIKGDFLSAYLDQLPYELTSAQKQTFRDICKDLSSGFVLNRLIQGDVGSGKTDIAILSMIVAIQAGYKVAFLVPTEVLAQQHTLKLQERLSFLSIPVYLLKGKLSKKEKAIVLEACQSDQPLVVVGTHALIQETVQIKQLGLQIIDEQHRFGVMQRLHLQRHNSILHSLYLTATPIPRSLMLSCYGDLDKSIMNELPGGRRPIKTYFVKLNKKEQVFQFCHHEITAGRQVFVIYPLVEDSEKIDLESAISAYEELQSNYPSLSIGLIHGRMKPAEKDEVMQRFKAKEFIMLVSTTVIEVGIDVPNASTIVIMHAERFGLSQLHQLRGRVGRGNLESSCFLVSNAKSEESKQRINAMLETTDGFKLAELDLKLRGPGDMLGYRQSGESIFDLTNLIHDEPILLKARQLASTILTNDPELLQDRHSNIKEQLSLSSAPFAGNKRLN